MTVGLLIAVPGTSAPKGVGVSCKTGLAAVPGEAVGLKAGGELPDPGVITDLGDDRRDISGDGVNAEEELMSAAVSAGSVLIALAMTGALAHRTIIANKVSRTRAVILARKALLPLG